MATSIALGDVVADALGEGRPRVQLQLKSIRANSQITFSGYGRGAARMTSLDAARLLIAVTGAHFATDAAEALARFQNLPATSEKGEGRTLEAFLERRIELIRYGSDPAVRGEASQRHANPVAEAALKLMWIGTPGPGNASAAVVRWFRLFGKSNAATFSDVSSRRRPILDEGRLTAATGDARLVRSVTVPTEALHRIALAL